jgi:hypothetical protein
MGEQEVLNAIGSVGFPIVVTMFLLTKGTTLVQNITTAINDMKTAIEGLTKRLEAIESERVKD